MVKGVESWGETITDLGEILPIVKIKVPLKLFLLNVGDNCQYAKKKSNRKYIYDSPSRFSKLFRLVIPSTVILNRSHDDIGLLLLPLDHALHETISSNLL